MGTSTRTASAMPWIGLIAAIFLCLQPIAALGQAVSDSCSEGTGLPPFLSSGADPNLLLILDNSGSMLDMAYVEQVGQCVDNAFDPNASYAGLFDPKKWYKWVDGVRQWRSGDTYILNEIVYSEGVFYRARTASTGPAAGFQIADDYSVNWQRVHEIPPWAQGGIYAANSFVQYDRQLYYTAAGGTANDPDLTDRLSIDDDTGVTWVPVNSTIDAPVVPANGSIVSSQGMLFYASGGTIGTRLDEGYFEEVPYTTSIEAEAAFAAKDGNAYRQDDLFIMVTEAGGVQSGVTAFAAQGNLLNWATASKFDIEKKILTGGKYNAELLSLVSQSRGCASHGFLKEVPILFKDGAVPLTPLALTFAINGSAEQNWIDTLDDTTRISILGISDGFIDSARQLACQAAIDEIAKGDEGSQGTILTNTATCLDYDGTNNVLAESNAAYNHSIHSCWQIVNMHYDSPSDLGNVSEIQNACAHIYEHDIAPSTIVPADSGYMCYGVYNENIPDAFWLATDATPPLHERRGARTGYLGRCWKQGDMPPGCEVTPCIYANPAKPGDNDYLSGTKWYRCNADNYLYSCDNIKYNTGKDECKVSWTPVIRDDGVIEVPNITCDLNAPAAPGGWDAANPPGINTIEGCIQSALWDYCQGITVPEVIDPSDQIFNTGDTWGMPGAMIDSGVMSMFGSNHALIVMKGYIRQPTAPQGLLHDVASNLRMGAMAFNANGADTECNQVDVTDNVVNYCPPGNKDGARLISAIKNGDEVMVPDDLATPLVDETVQHVDDMTVAINDIRATAWTPLAEALYNAVGYYGQNGNRRLDPDDFKTAVEDAANFPDPVQYWCQDNNILVITEGASTADINQNVIDFVTTTALEDGTVLVAEEKQCLDADGLPLLYGSTYLDDMTYFAQNAPVDQLYSTAPAPNLGRLQSSDGTWHDKQHISTFIVSTGILRDDGTTDECNPATIMTNAASNGGTTLLAGENPAQLEANLKAALADIMSRASAGSAASVISSSRTGEGAAYQAIFWPKIGRGFQDDLTWIGDVHSLFVDTKSQMFDDYSGGAATAQNITGRLWTEDANGNGRLDSGEDTNNNNCLDGDRRIFFYFDEVHSPQETKICFNDSVRTSAPPNCLQQNDYCGDPAEPLPIKDFTRYFWSAAQQLQEIDDANITLNRPVVASGRWDWSGAKRRYIFTWNDLNHDGIVDNATEILDLDDGTDWGALSALAGTDPTNYKHDILKDFNMTDPGAMTEFVTWLRGADEIYEWGSGPDANGDLVNDFIALTDDINGNGKQDYVYRCRRYPSCVPPNDPSVSANPEWRLGDIIHSTPTLVAQPAEGYHTLYRDPTYAWFVKKYRYRRQVVYFGANDGMMHATNSGFFHEETTSFCRKINDNYNIEDADPANDNPCLDTGPELGDELWAYVPYNLQPHLQCMSDPGYDHKYFVDQKPRVVDVQIFAEEGACTANLDDPGCIHPSGWGTILIGAMRFGGAALNAAELDPANTPPLADERRFVSSYFILDVTDPERPPELLGEMTMTRDTTTGLPMEADLGYTTPSPTGVVMRDDGGRSTWYLIFGSGPETLSGENTQQGKLAVLPLNWLKGGLNWTASTPPNPDAYTGTKKAFRIPNLAPLAAPDDGGIIPIPIDASDPRTSSSFTGDLVNIDYNVGVQVINNLGDLYKSDAIYFGTVDGSSFITYGAADPHYNPLIPFATHWDGGGRLFRLITRNELPGDPLQVSYPHQWTLTQLIDAKAPITAAPGIGWDGENYWIYFGTGRFFDKDDKTDADYNYFFGIKEPMHDYNIYSNPYTCDTYIPADPACLSYVRFHTPNWTRINFDVSSPTALSPNAAQGSRGLFRADHVLVVDKQFGVINNKPYAFCEDGYSGTDCPLSSMGLIDLDGGGNYAFDDLRNYIVGGFGADHVYQIGKGIDGWYRQFRDERERNIGQATLLGGLTTFTTYQPYSDICTAEGLSFLYGVHFQTGTAWYEDVFGIYSYSGKQIVRDKLSLGRGLASTGSLHVGQGPNDATAIIQTSTGEIVEAPEKNLPMSPKPPGKAGWTDSCN